jgi:hypothetical protein
MKLISNIYKTALLVLFLFPLSLFSQNQNTTQQNNSKAYEFTGTIISKNGNIIKVQQTDTLRLPGKNIEGTLSKYFEKIFFGAKTTGWLDVGKMKIKSVENNIVTMELLEETSIITINGQKEDHFQPGFIVKFSWQEFPNE